MTNNYASQGYIFTIVRRATKYYCIYSNTNKKMHKKKGDTYKNIYNLESMYEQKNNWR